MALDFGILQPVNIAGQFMAGRQEAQQNQLAQQQALMRQQEIGMRQQEFDAQAKDRETKLANAQKRSQFLTNLSSQMEKGGHKLNRETLSSMLNFGLQSNEDSLIKLAGEGLRALDEQDQFETEMGRFTSNVPSAAPVPTNALAPASAPVAAAAPVNALTAPPTAAPAATPSTNAMVGNYTRPQVEQMLTSSNARVREMGKNLLAALPKAAAPSAPSDVSRLIAERDALPPGDPNRVTYDAAIRKETQFASQAKMSPSEGRRGTVGETKTAGAQPLKPLTELQTIKLRTDVAKDYKTATTTLSQMDDLLQSIDKVKTAPGLAAATGYTGKYAPSFPGGAAAQAETRLANLRGKVTALGKSLAASTGAIGSIATQEWKVLADQVAALDEVKGEGPLLEQINAIEEQTKGAIDRIRDQYEKTRSEDFERFPQFRNLPASKKIDGKDATGGATGSWDKAGATGVWGKAEAEAK